ncbi:NUDIX domain-containing protein [Hamadaea sp. NPDC051192]|uniref:NUDIX hydrolase n=1 Tax=Hamadaea sp. NPDC051192 TaxID=3154940 RepID=UPI003429904F
MADRDHALLRIAVDLAILTVRDADFQVLLIERRNPPHQGLPALPGGFLRDDEDPERAALRELREETSLDASNLILEQLTVRGAPDRDPRGRVVSVPYMAIAPDLPIPTAGSDASAAHWVSMASALRDASLAFDHGHILAEALELARARLEHTTVATAFCHEPFTIGDLRHVYEVVWGTTLDAGNFSRKVTKTEGFIEATGDRRAHGTGRPAATYRRGTARRLHPPIFRNPIEI